MTNSVLSIGSPAFVFVSDGMIVRMTPTDLAEDETAPWEFEDRDCFFRTPLKRSVAVYTQGYLSMLYSDKRVDFDPNINGDKPICNLSDYERIAWEERSLSCSASSLVFSAPTIWLPLGCLLA